MITNQKWDTLVWVLIWLFIISIIILWLINILSSNYVIEDDYNRNNKLLILQNSTENIIKNIDTSFLTEKDIFYLYKNKDDLKFEIKIHSWTNSENIKYKYIDEFWDLVFNTWSFLGKVYARILYIQRNDTTLWPQNQIIKIWLRELMNKVK